MARKKHLISVHTSTGTTAPTGASLYLGEIAVQHTPNNPAIWIKMGNNEASTDYEKFIGSTEIINMLNDTRILGSGYTYSGISYVNSSTTIADAYSALTQEMIDDEKVVSSALNDLNGRLGELSAATENLHVDMILGSGYTYSGISYVNSSTTIADAYSALTKELLDDELDIESLSAAVLTLSATVEDDGLVISSALNDLNDRINDLSDAIEGGGGGASSTELLELSAAVKTKEFVIAAALNDLNERVNELSGNTGGGGQGGGEDIAPLSGAVMSLSAAVITVSANTGGGESIVKMHVVDLPQDESYLTSASTISISKQLFDEMVNEVNSGMCPVLRIQFDNQGYGYGQYYDFTCDYMSIGDGVHILYMMCDALCEIGWPGFIMLTEDYYDGPSIYFPMPATYELSAATTGISNSMLTGVSAGGANVSVTNKVAAIPSASSNTFGVVKTGNFLTNNNGTISVTTGTSNTSVARGDQFNTLSAASHNKITSLSAATTGISSNLSSLSAAVITVSASTGGGGGDTSSCVHKTGGETIAGDKTFTDDIVVGNASNIKYGASSSGGFTKATKVATGAGTNSISFTGLTDEPKAFVANVETPGSTILMVIGDSSGVYGIYNNGSQHNYSASFTKSYSNGTLTITAPAGITFASGDYDLSYYYGSGTLTFKTTSVTPGQGQTSATFTGSSLTEVPAMYACFLETAVNNEQYRRVAGYTNSAAFAGSVASFGVTFLTGGPTDTTSSFSVSYSNGLVINSGGQNAGGYFHNPGTYTLYYLMASDIGGGGGSYGSLKDELDNIRNTISGIETLLAAI